MLAVDTDMYFSLADNIDCAYDTTITDTVIKVTINGTEVEFTQNSGTLTITATALAGITAGEDYNMAIYTSATIYTCKVTVYKTFFTVMRIWQRLRPHRQQVSLRVFTHSVHDYGSLKRIYAYGRI